MTRSVRFSAALHKDQRDWESKLYELQIKGTIFKPQRGVLRKNVLYWGHYFYVFYWTWDHHFIRSSVSLYGRAGSRLTFPQSCLFGSHSEEGLREMCQGSGCGDGKEESERKDWTGDMSGLQGKDSSLISKLFFKDPEHCYGPAPGIAPTTSPTSFPKHSIATDWSE